MTAGQCHLCGRFTDPRRVDMIDGRKVHKLCGFRFREQARRARRKA